MDSVSVIQCCGFHSCHTCWFVGFVSVTCNCMGCVRIVPVGPWFLCLSHNCMGSVSTHNCMGSKPITLGLLVLCLIKFCGFHAYHPCWFVDSVSMTHNCMGSMSITLVGLRVLCFGVIIFWDLCLLHVTILWVLCHCLYFVISDHVHLSSVISHVCLWPSSCLSSFIRDVCITSDSYYSHSILT